MGNKELTVLILLRLLSTVSTPSTRHVGKWANRRLLSLFLMVLLVVFVFSSASKPNTDLNVANGAGSGKVWVQFKPSDPGARHDVKLKSSDNLGISVDSNIPGMYRSDVFVENLTFQVLSIPYAADTAEVGKPKVPMIRRYLEVPYDVNLTVNTLYSSFTTLDGYYVYPAQKPISENETAPFVIDSTTYSTNAFYPSYNALVEQPITLRGHRIASLALYPVQFNPVTRQLRVYSKIEVKINYGLPAQIEGIEKRLESEAFEELCQSFVLNYKAPDSYLTRRYKDVGSPAVDYLIITNDTFVTQVQPLTEWKMKKGYRVEVVTTTTIGSTAAQIKQYIQNAYDTWNPPPTYILLVGDSNHIPPHYETPHYSVHHGGYETATDLYYATVDGADYYPDIFIGRLSVDTTTQATTIVNKIINYEQNPPSIASFYSDVSVCAYFQDDDQDGYEDRRFVLTSEEIRDYMLTQGYNVQRIYCTTQAVNPTNYNNGDFDQGDPLPPDLLRPGFLWDGDTMDIDTAINAGRFLVYHRDHGGSRNFWSYKWSTWGSLEGWGDPQYTTTDVAGLANGDRLPVVFSVECQCGWFDNEVDQQVDPVLTRSFECFSEELLRYQYGGAVAVFGATRNSPSGHNDDLAKGLFDAIWPGFDPSIQTGAMYELGQILTYGKMYMLLHPWFGYEQTEFELFHLFGDPEMSIWTDQPQTLTVIHPLAIGSGGSQKFVVNVTASGNPVNHALVSLYKPGDVHTIAYTDAGGHAFFDVTPSTAGDMYVTVTAHNYRPYQGIIEVTANGAAITVSPNTGSPGASFTITGSNFGSSETVNINFGSTPLGSAVTTTGGSFSKSFAVPSVSEGSRNVMAIGATSGRAAVAVFRVLPPSPPPDPYIYDQWDPSTWHLNPAGGDPIWDNPDIQLYDKSTGAPVSSGNLQLGTTYIIKATIHNTATVPASGTQVSFKWAPIGAGQTIWNLISTPTVNVPASPSTVQASVEWTPMTTGHICIIAEIYHPSDSNAGNNKGQENTAVHYGTSPAVISFDVYNPTNFTALPYLEVTQSGGTELWATTIERSYPQEIQPWQSKTAKLIVDVPASATLNDSHIITVTTYIDGVTIGGIQFKVGKAFPWDVTGDKYVGIDDIVAVAEHFGTQPGYPNWNIVYDINWDDYCGVDDIVTTAEHFGHTRP